MEILKNSYFRNILLLAILLRLLIMPFFFHPDIKTYHFQASFLQKGVFDIYSYIPQHKGELPIREEFVYFPLTYFTLGFYQILASPVLGPDFYSWVSNASASAVEQIGVYRYLFVLKLPYLVLDLLIAFLLTRFALEESGKKRIFLLWLFNPFSIVILYIFSNVDIFPAFLSVLSLFFARKNNFVLAGLMLGLGASFKAYPLLFLPFILLMSQKWKERLLLVFSALVPFLLIIAPFLKSSGFQEATLNSGLTTRIISNGIPIGFGELIFPAVVMLAAVYFFAWQRRLSSDQIPIFCFISILVIFMTIHFHIQWLFWLMPFAVLILAQKRELMWSFVLIATLFILIPILYDDSSMSVSTLAVINPLFQNLPTPFKFIERFYNPLSLQSILHSLLFGAGLVTIFRLIKKNDDVS